MHNKLYWAALGCCILSVIFIILSLAASDWMKACASTAKLFDLPKSSALDSSTYDDKKICWHVGLFEQSVTVYPDISVTVSMKGDPSNDSQEVTAGLINLTIPLLLFAIGLIGLGVRSRSKNSVSSQIIARKYHFYGTMVMVLAAFLVSLAALIYYLTLMPVVNNSLFFLYRTKPSSLECLKRMDTNKNVSSPPVSESAFYKFLNEINFRFVQSNKNLPTTLGPKRTQVLEHIKPSFGFSLYSLFFASFIVFLGFIVAMHAYFTSIGFWDFLVTPTT
ncbi:unnamed protein product [Clavelina lepadiformis]|uniref:Uncharacterized protein n=1 Tax=Clavelina lepadiformis TaxID=159417 RepID=A0ABP0GS12_CLALP